MDPILIIILVGVGLLAGPKLVKTGLARLIANADENKTNNLSHQMLKKEYKEKQQKEKYRQRLIKKGIDPDKVIKADMDKFHHISFTGIKTKKKAIVNVREDVSFNESEDVLLKGRLHIVDVNGRRTVQDIYLFQPRVFSSEGVFLGPKLDKTGKLSDKYTYLCRQNGGEILNGYMPKREIFTGMRFDFIPDDSHNFIDRNPNFADFSSEDRRQAEQLEQFINIDIPRDGNGQYIPVNLNDPKQKAEFEKYKKAHLGNKKTPKEYFRDQLNIAKAAFYKYLNEHRPDYAYAPSRTTEQEESAEPIKVESSKKAEQSINDFYKRFDYYIQSPFGERYNDYNGEYGYTSGPHHHHGRR